MSPPNPGEQLSADDRATACALWDALMFPATHLALAAARQQLVDAPAHIQQAIINEIGGAIQGHREPQSDQNPFAVSA